METQHFHTKRGCLSYITYDTRSGEAMLIDPSTEMGAVAYLDFLQVNHLTLKYIVETHTHADHVSLAHELKEVTGARIVRHKNAPSPRRDISVGGGEELFLGEAEVHILGTPGHTNESISLYNGKEVFTGDALLIGGTGRTDFQIGESAALYQSLHQMLATLPKETVVRPGHDYQGRNQALLGDELHTNPRLLLSESEFVSLMDGYHPAKPELFDQAIQENSR
ncbi:MAG: MBL fold metallo-hydrolase [Candidatus Moranbacteria bacterium]|nr:MBL fold metallo-hydrolase [Candidatus Moranbacteria bacterium]